MTDHEKTSRQELFFDPKGRISVCTTQHDHAVVTLRRDLSVREFFLFLNAARFC